MSGCGQGFERGMPIGQSMFYVMALPFNGLRNLGDT